MRNATNRAQSTAFASTSCTLSAQRFLPRRRRAAHKKWSSPPICHRQDKCCSSTGHVTLRVNYAGNAFPVWPEGREHPRREQGAWSWVRDLSTDVEGMHSRLSGQRVATSWRASPAECHRSEWCPVVNKRESFGCNCSKLKIRGRDTAVS